MLFHFTHNHVLFNVVKVAAVSVLVFVSGALALKDVRAVELITEEQLLREVNILRTQHQLPLLVLDPQLTKAAHSKAAHMSSYSYFAHISPNGITPWYWIDNSGYKFRRAGENLAMGFSSAESTVKAWSDSNSHRANILNSGFTDVGFSVHNISINGRQHTLIVQMLGSKM